MTIAQPSPIATSNHMMPVIGSFLPAASKSHHLIS
jgi:hypothetical protein